MKVLWFVNRIFPIVEENSGLKVQAGGHWMLSLCLELANSNEIELAVVMVSPEFKGFNKYKHEGILYYNLPIHTIGNKLLLNNKITSLFVKAFSLTQKKDVSACAKVVFDFSPEVVHVHGTEPFYGLVSSQINIPTVISIQGILSEYIKDFWGATSLATKFKYLGVNYTYLLMRKNAKREKEIFLKNKNFIGRTTWDKSHVQKYNPNSQYYHCNEVLRPIFKDVKWNLNKASLHVVYTTTTCLPYKGTILLFKAIALLITKFPNIKVRVGGPIPMREYGKYLRSSIKQLGIEKVVNFLGKLDEIQISKELASAHVYVLPSFIENSPNSLAEAQIVGVPTIASYSGGTPSMITDCKTGLFFPKGDYTVLANRIEKIFNDNDLANNLSVNARKVATNRHDPEFITKNMLSIYKSIKSS